MSKPTPQCAFHPRRRSDTSYWRGCPDCHPVIEVEDIRDRLMSDVINPKQAVYELLCMRLDALGKHEPLRLVTYDGPGTLRRHNVGAINGQELPEPKSLWRKP